MIGLWQFGVGVCVSWQEARVDGNFDFGESGKSGTTGTTPIRLKNLYIHFR